MDIDARVIDVLQLIDGRQTPVGVPSQAQIGVVGAGLVPIHVRSVVLFCPGKAGGRVGPCSDDWPNIRRGLILRAGMRGRHGKCEQKKSRAFGKVH